MFVKRNAENEIILISKVSIPGIADELIENDAYELVDFLQEEHEITPVVEFRRSDRDLIRVLEDVIDLLTVKGIIQFTDLPKAAQQKLLSRQNIRHRIASLDLLSDDPDAETVNLDMK
jgi:hypothetical protein